VVCIREVQKSLTFSVKRLLEQKIERFNAGDYFDVQDKRIMTKRGGVTVFEGMQDQTAESMKSFEAFDRAWFEEAQSASQRSLDLLRPTIRKPGSELWFSWNPKNATDPIDKLLRAKEPPPDSVVVHASYRDNPWLPEELRASSSTTRSATRTSSRTSGSASTSAFRGARLQELAHRGVRSRPRGDQAPGRGLGLRGRPDGARAVLHRRAHAVRALRGVHGGLRHRRHRRRSS
jgi:hypothetical protein